MIILSANNLKKNYGTDVIIENVSFHINAGDRVGIIGRNGAGKTTLLNMLTGELQADEGEFFVSQDTRVGYLKQRDNFFKGDRLIDAIDGIFTDIHRIEKDMEYVTMELEKASAAGNSAYATELSGKLDSLHEEYDRKGGYTYKSEITGVLTSMAFTRADYNKLISELSGGERTRLALAALLLEKPDLLFLDEPTNHLDIDTLKWLEQYLSAYRGTIVIVSHDRYFLDQVVNRIFEVENHKLWCYNGKYSDFAEQKRLRRESQLRAYNKQQKEIRRQEDMIRIMKEHNTEHLVKRAQSREKRLAMLDIVDKPESLEGRMKIRFKQNFQSGNDVMLVEDLSQSVGWGHNRVKLFENVDMDIKRGEKICIVGPNGVGKTTLLKTFLGEMEPEKGRIKLGVNVAFGYYDQGQLLLNGENTVLEELKESYRLYTDTEMRSILGRFLFRGDEVFLKVKDLSGGEKARLSLVKLMLSGANTLILDEPTNHLDIESKEVFEEALLEFPGTAIIVSHDRYFLSRIPERILELNSDGMTEFLGKYDYYLEKKAEREKIQNESAAASGSGACVNSSSDNRTAAAGSVSDAREQRALNKAREAEERRRLRAIERLELEIEKLEEENNRIDSEMAKEENMTNFELLNKLSIEKAANEKRLEEAMEEWEELSLA